MILKSMGVECKKDDMDGYAGEVDEEATGKFTFLQFCQVAVDDHHDVSFVSLQIKVIVFNSNWG